jgi:gentisate 1,2-dioxygenase
VQTTDIADQRRAWRDANVEPLWENRLAHGGKRGVERTHAWHWRTMKPLIDDALRQKGMDVVERRVLSLINPEPRMPAGPTTVTNLNGGLQILAPGESTRPHRHSMNAIRFVLDGRGATTIVDGKRCTMEVGDLVLTPGWTWHEHEHDAAEPIVWLDVLDAQLHRYLGTDRFEPGPAHDVPDASGETYRFPWADAVAALSKASRAPDGAKWHHYVNPRTGGPVMDLLDCYAIELDAGTETIAMRTTAHAICAVMEGRGTSRIGDDTIAWEPKDLFTFPDGAWITHHAEGGTARLFICSDREVLVRLGLLTEEYGAPNKSAIA